MKLVVRFVLVASRTVFEGGDIRGTLRRFGTHRARRGKRHAMLKSNKAAACRLAQNLRPARLQRLFRYRSGTREMFNRAFAFHEAGHAVAHCHFTEGIEFAQVAPAGYWLMPPGRDDQHCDLTQHAARADHVVANACPGISSCTIALKIASATYAQG
jgi:hypothetical protein